MRIFIATLVAAALVGCLVLLTHLLAAQLQAWEAADLELSSTQQFIARASIWLTKYWYLPAAGIIAACYGMAAFVRIGSPGQGSPPSEELPKTREQT